jgi:hypothetical protein
MRHQMLARSRTARLIGSACLMAVVLPVGAASQDRSPDVSTCVPQVASLPELQDAFDHSRVPTAAELNGTWAAVALIRFDAPARLDCMGLRRNDVFEWAMSVDQLQAEIEVVNTPPQRWTMTVESGYAVLMVDVGGDLLWTDHCRLASPAMLVCLGYNANGVYLDGMVLRRMDGPDIR